MELVERYLQAVRFWLPKQKKQDIVAELSEDIHAQIEEEEIALGRKLDKIDLETILKRRGHPILVANHYLPQRYLIGPVLFPIYLFVLKIVALCYLVPSVLWIVFAAFSRSNLAEHTRQPWLSGLSTFWSGVFVSAAVVSLVFAIIERAQPAKSRLFEDWNPRKLPAVRHFDQITRSGASTELAVNLLMTIWWAANASSPITLNHLHVQISPSPLWPCFFWGFLGIGLVNTTLSAVNLMRPYWTGLRATIRLLADSAGAVLLCWLLKANIVAGMVIANVSPARAQQLTDSTNMWMARMLPAAIVIAVVIALTGVFRLARLRTTKARFPWEAIITPTLL